MKKIAIGSSCVLFFALAAFAVWWYVTPHSAREELERAEALVKAFLAKGGLSAEDRARWAEEIERAYRRVLDRYPESRYPEARVSHEQALWRLAEVYERTLKDPESALARYREFLKRFPASGRAEEAAWRIARLLEDMGRFAEAGEAYRTFAERFKEVERAPEALIRRARIFQRKLAGATVDEILKAYGEVVTRFPKSRFAPEALWERGKIYEGVEEHGSALKAYRRIVDRYPECDFAARAQRRIGLIYGEKLDKQEEARKAFEKLERKYPGSPSARGAGDLKRKAAGKKAEKDEAEYFRKHYGRPGADQFWDKRPVAPEASWSAIARQKLDFRHYRIDAQIEPEKGTLRGSARFRLAAGGAPGKSLLLMLNSLFRVEAITCASSSLFLSSMCAAKARRSPTSTETRLSISGKPTSPIFWATIQRLSMRH